MPRPANRHPADPTPFGILEDAFILLATPPRALTLDGTVVAGLPGRPIPLDELRSILLHPSTTYDTRDAALGALVYRAQAEGGRYLVGLAGMLLPGLRRAATVLVECCPHKAADIEAEMLAGVVAEARRLDPSRVRPAVRLVWAAWDAAVHLVHEELAERGRPGPLPLGGEPPRPFGHPDFVLARAVAEGVIDPREAELIGSTRLRERTLHEAADRLGVPYSTAQSERYRAEAVLVHWINDGCPPRPRPPAPAPRATRQARGPDRAARRLAGAMAAGVVRPADADLVAAARIHGMSPDAIAEHTGISSRVVTERLVRAEQALFLWFKFDIFAPELARRAGSKGVGRSRRGRSAARQTGVTPTAPAEREPRR